MSVNPLATQHQLEIEEAALGLFASAAMRRTLDDSRRLFAEDPRARTRAGRATLEQNLRETAFSAAACAASRDAASPGAFWTINLPRRWYGREVPGSRHGVDNPDNIYRVIAIDARARYEIHGRVPEHPAADVSFTLLSEFPGNGADSRSLGVLTLDQLELDAGGRFVLTLDAEPALGRRNHLQVDPGAKLVLVRDSMLSWSSESPLWLEVTRTSGPAGPRATDRAGEAAAIAARAAAYWVRSMPLWFGRHPFNVVPKAGAENFSYAKQAQAGARFRLADDEALVITADPMGARYFGCQVADPWGATPEYAKRTSSLNRAQAVGNADATITYVISAADPGVHNWLDTAGLDEGTLLLRWQGLPPGGIDPERSIRFAGVVKHRDLRERLAPGMRWVGREQRLRQRAARARAYARRLFEG